MSYIINTIFLYFIIYSILGWICEVIFCRIIEGKWTNRGFLLGPYCPIYGFGGLIVVFLLDPIKSNGILLFILAMILTTLLEYITSYLMEKLFNAKWWDYSDTPFNLNGRVCLPMSVIFGLLGVIIVYFIHPYTTILINIIPDWLTNYLVGALIALFLTDIITTLNTILNLKERLSEVMLIAEKISKNSKEKVINSELIKQLEEIKNTIISKTNIFHNRIIEAFPSLEFKKYSQQLNELKILIHEKKRIKKSNKK